MVIGPQIFEARRLARWNAETLAVKAGISFGTVYAAEQCFGQVTIASEHIEAIERAFGLLGIIFQPGVEGEAAVRWRDRADIRRGSA